MQTSFEIAGARVYRRGRPHGARAQTAGTLTAAFGTLEVQNREFTADIVHAGDSVSGSARTPCRATWSRAAVTSLR